MPSTLFLILAGVVLVFWTAFALSALWGMRKVPKLIRFAPKPSPTNASPRLTVIVPARNEEDSISRCLESLLLQDYPDLQIIVINDRSTDRTGQLAEIAAASSGGKIEVIHIHELPEGWLGKCHALAAGASRARGEYILFTDGDVIFEPTVLSHAMAYVEHERADMLVVYPDLLMEGFWQKLITLGFGHIFLVAFPPWRAASDRSRQFVGVGAFNLVRRELYESLGGHDALRLQVIDDAGLGKLVKRARGRLRVAFGTGLLRVRWQPSASAMVTGLEKNAFAGMGYSLLKTLGAVAVLLFLYWWPWIGMFFGPAAARLMCLVPALCIPLGYGLVGRKFMPINPLYAFALPVGASILCWAFLRSAVITLRQGGIRWRDSYYPLQDLKQFRL